MFGSCGPPFLTPLPTVCRADNGEPQLVDNVCTVALPILYV